MVKSVLLDLNATLTPRQEFLIRQDFDEAKHLRGKDGKFASKSLGGKSALNSGLNSAKRKTPKVSAKDAVAVQGEVDGAKKKTKKKLKNSVAQAFKAAAIGALVYVGINVAVGAALVGAYAVAHVAVKVGEKKREEEWEKKAREWAESSGAGDAVGFPTQGVDDKWYETLGVSKDADYETVKKAYRDQARKMHPDINKDPEAEEQMKAINTAFENIDKIFQSKTKKDSALSGVISELYFDFKEGNYARDKNGRFAAKAGSGGGTLLKSGGEMEVSASAAARSGGGAKKVAAIAVGGATAATIGTAALAAAYVVKESRGAAEDISGFDYPDNSGNIDFSRYDDLEPGTLIYKGFGVPGVPKGQGMFHYSVYMGKDPDTGEHMTIQCNSDPKNPGTVSVIPISIEAQFAALPKRFHPNSSHYKPVPPEKLSSTGKKFTPEEVMDRANALVGQPYKYGAVKDNCESIARAIVEGEAVTTQGAKVSKTGQKVAYGMVNTMIERNRKKAPQREPAKTAAELADILAKRSSGELSAASEASLNQMRSQWESAEIPTPQSRGSNAVEDNIFNKVFSSKGKGSSQRRKDSDDNSEAESFIQSLGMKLPAEFAKEVDETVSQCGDKTTAGLVRMRLWTAYFEVLTATLNVLDQGRTGELRSDSARGYVLSQINLDFDPSKHPRDNQGRFAAKKNSILGSRLQFASSATASEAADPVDEIKMSRPGRRLALAVGVPTAAGVGAIALAGVGVATLYKEGNKGASDISKMTFPNPESEYDFSRYDDFQPGDMIRKAFTVPGQPPDKGFLHYAVYKGKDPKTGEHMVIHAVPDPKDPASTVAIVEQSIEDAVKRGGKKEMHWHSYYESVPESGRIQGDKTPTKAEALDRAESLIGQPYDYYSVRSNCESFARLITEGVAYETQGPEASERGKEFVAKMTKRMLDKARKKSPIWQGRTPKDSQQYAEVLARMQAGSLSDQVKQEMASNRQAWESAPQLPVSEPTRQSLEQIMGWTLNRLDVYEGKNRRRADGDMEDFYEATGLKTPDEYAKLVAEVAKDASPVMRPQVEAYLWSNYLQMTVALMTDGPSLKKDSARSLVVSSLRADFTEEKHPRDRAGKFAKKGDGGKTKLTLAEKDARFFKAAGIVSGTAVVGAAGLLTVAGGALLYKELRPQDVVMATAQKQADIAKKNMSSAFKNADKKVEELINSDRLPKEANDILIELRGEVRLQAGKTIANSDGYKKIKYDRKSQTIEMRGKDGSILVLSRAGDQIISFNATKSPIPFGQIVADDAPTYTVAFQIDQAFKSSEKSTTSAKEIVKKVTDSWNTSIKALPDNALIETSAYDGDGKGKRRASIYKRIGFQYLPGQNDGALYAQKKDGVFQALTKEQMEVFGAEMSNFDSLVTPRQLYELMRLDAEFDAAKHPRDNAGRFASKSEGKFMRGAATAEAVGSGSVVTGSAGSLVNAGKSYTEAFKDDPDLSAAIAQMSAARAEVARQRKRCIEMQDKGITPSPEDVKAFNAASAASYDAYKTASPLLEKKMEGLRTELLSDSGVSRKQAEKIIDSKELISYPPNYFAKRKVRDDLVEYAQLTGSSLPTLETALVAPTTRGRSYADPYESKALVISGDQMNKTTIFHEASHHLEVQNPNLVKASAEWAKKRSDGTGEHELSEIATPDYGKGEKAYRDSYIDPYAGRVYRKEDGEAEATEVLSMGMQFMESPKSMAILYAFDPDHFNYTVGAIRPNGRPRKDSLTAHGALVEWLQTRADFDLGLHPRDNKGRFSRRTGDRGMGVWYEGRRTGVLVRAKNKAEAKELADKKKKRGGTTAVVRELTEAEERTAQKGRWVRTGPNGEKPGELKIRGKGPRPKNYEGDDD